MEISSSISTDTNISVRTKRPVHPNSLKNLKLWPKGVSGNKKGNKKGVASIPHAIDRIIDRKGAEELAESLYNTAWSGSVSAHRTIYEIGGVLSNSPQVAIQQNNSPITPEMLAEALELLRINNI